MRTDKQQAGEPILTHPLAVMDYRNYRYWFTLLYRSINASNSSNILILSGFIFPAFSNFLLAFNQLSISCSSIRYFDGFRLLVSINDFISLYLANQRSSCFIELTPSVLSKRYYRDLRFVLPCLDPNQSIQKKSKYGKSCRPPCHIIMSVNCQF